LTIIYKHRNVEICTWKAKGCINYLPKEKL